MNAMSTAIGGPRKFSDLSSRIGLRSLDRTAIWSGVISRRDRIREIEAEIDFACESAATGCVSRMETQTREDWDAANWRRYLAEAVPRRVSARSSWTRCARRPATLSVWSA